MKRFFAVAAAVVVVAGVGFVGIGRLRAAPAAAGDLQTATVSRGSLVATINTAGTVETADAVDLTFQGSGQVKEVKVQEGDAVQAGQVIATLDDTDAQLQVSSAEIGLDNAQLQLQQAQKGASDEELAAAKAQLTSAQESLKALQAGPSDSDVKTASLELDKAKNSLWGAQSQRDATCGNANAGSSACNQANASVANAEIAVQLAQMDYDKAQQGPSDQDLAAAQAQVAQAQLNYSQLADAPAPEDVHAAENQVKEAQISLQQAQAKLAQCQLTAPFDGTVTQLSLKVGQMVGSSASSAAVTLAGSGGLDITADLAEADVARVKVGQEAAIVLDAIPDRTLKGHVLTMARTGTNTQGVVNFPVTIALDDTDPDIKPGMTANVTVTVDQRDNVLLVPSRAIQVQGNQHLVQVLQQGQEIQVPVEIGLSGDNGTEILGDTLREGDQVVLNSTGTSTSARGLGGGLGGLMRIR